MSSNSIKSTRRTRPLVTCGIALALALSGCGLIQDTLGLTPPPGAINLEIQGPAGAETAVTVSGAEFNDRFTDDGTGFSTALTLRPGTYTISASPQAGFTAQVSVTQKNGNSTKQNAQTITLESNARTDVRVNYIGAKP